VQELVEFNTDYNAQPLPSLTRRTGLHLDRPLRRSPQPPYRRAGATRIEEIAIEGEQVHKEWEASWQEPIAPSAETVATVATAPAAIGENDEPPNRGDNGHRRVQPTAAKKLMLSLVSVKCLVSDVPASNFDPGELEIAGELSLAIGGFVIPWRGGARQSRIQDYQRAFSVSRGSSSTTAKSQSRQNDSGASPRIRKSNDRRAHYLRC